jgi:putative intracellular protease/amidase
MRIVQALVFAAAATLSLSAFADPSVAPSSATASAVMVSSSTHSAYRLTKDEAEHMRGSFRLTDGRTITVTNRMNKLFVDLDGKREELLPVAPKKFITRDTGATVAFNQVPFADEVVVNQAAR